MNLPIVELLRLSYQDRASFCRKISEQAKQASGSDADLQNSDFSTLLAEACEILVRYSPAQKRPYIGDDLLRRDRMRGENPHTESRLDHLLVYDQIRNSAKGFSIYRLLWEAAISSNSLIPLSFLGDLGHEAYKSLGTLFENEIFYQQRKSKEILTCNTPSEDIKYIPKNNAEKRNLEWLTLRNDIFWMKLINGHDFMYPEEYPDITIRHRPLATIINGTCIGALLSYPFKINDLTIVPLYCDMFRVFAGLILTKGGHVVTCLEEKLATKSWRGEELCKEIYAAVNKFDAGRLKSQNNQESSQRKKLLLGHTVNFGHTIINEASLSSAAVKESDLLIRQNILPLIGNFDYLEVFGILRKKYMPSQLDYLCKYGIDSNASLYLIPETVVVPGSSMLPCKGALELIADKNSRISVFPSQIFSTAPNRIDDPPTAVYVAFGGRTGTRNCLNSFEIVEEISRLDMVSTIIVDGTTAVPCYSDKREGMDYAELSYQTAEPAINEDDLLRLSKICHASNCLLLSIDRLPFGEKIAICSRFSVDCAVVPYGSSSMFAIYILNTEVVLTGSEQFSAFLDEWKWHVTCLCFPERSLPERFAPSATMEKNGYSVEISRLMTIVRESLGNIGPNSISGR